MFPSPGDSGGSPGDSGGSPGDSGGSPVSGVLALLFWGARAE